MGESDKEGNRFLDRDLVLRWGERWCPSIVGGVVGIACAPIVQDIAVMSCGAAVVRHEGVDIFAGVVVVVVGVGVWCSSLRVEERGVFLDISESSFASVHNSVTGVSVSMPEWTGAGSAQSSVLESELSVSMPE